MKSFTDSSGKTWNISLNLAQAKKVKERIGIDFLDGGQSLNRLATDPYILADTLFVLCESQATAANVTDLQFGEALSGDPIEAATDALLNELVDFFPSRQRGALQTLLAKWKQAQEQVATMTESKLTSEAMDQIIQRTMAQTESRLSSLIAGGSSGNAPDA